MDKNPFLPISQEDMKTLNWDRLDFILITGDAYVDHPSFGAAVIGRVLENDGYRVGVIAQPDWRNKESFRILGRPRLAFLVTSGNIDSMVAHYSANKRRRKKDLYSPGGETGKRPDRAVIVYTAMVRQAFRKIPVIIGGLEASLRRLTHYDYHSDRLRRSILLDSKADILVYGMGEAPIREIARRLNEGEPVGSLTDIRGTVYRTGSRPGIEGIRLPSWEENNADRKVFAKSVALSYRETNPHTARPLIERTDDRWIVQNPPSFPLTQEELNRTAELPYTRKAHPRYDGMGGIPALEEVRFSIIRNRGCYGNCSFCSLAFHQGKIVTTRSDDSIVNEAVLLTKLDGFKGYIHDIGGPTANFTGPACAKQEKSGPCPDRDCLAPRPCPRLDTDHAAFMELLRKVRELPGIKKVFIRSGIRFDYLMAGNPESFIREFCLHHISGQLKVAPEHISEGVLKIMNKPPAEVFLKFKTLYEKTNRELGLKQFLIPYLIASHPGCRLRDAVDLAVFLKKWRFIPEQIQDFYPTPGTVSTCMYYTETDPVTGKPVYIPRSEEDRRMQRALMQFQRPENRELVLKALKKTGRTDLIGNGPDCLVPARPFRRKTAGKRYKK